MDWTPVSYAYDGSFAGFLTCVFASYAHREEPMSFSTPEDGRISLWPERTVDTDETRAQRVYRSLAPRLGQEGRRLAVYGFLTCLEERELHLWRFLRLGYDRGPWVVRDLTDDRVAVLTRAVGHLTGEAHLLKGFTRFSEQEGVLVGEIAPKTGCSPSSGPTSAPAIRRSPSSSTTAPTGRRCFTGPGGGPSFPWRRSAPPPPAGRSGTSAACGGGFTTPSPSRGGRTPGAA